MSQRRVPEETSSKIYREPEYGFVDSFHSMRGYKIAPVETVTAPTNWLGTDPVKADDSAYNAWNRVSTIYSTDIYTFTMSFTDSEWVDMVRVRAEVNSVPATNIGLSVDGSPVNNLAPAFATYGLAGTFTEIDVFGYGRTIELSISLETSTNMDINMVPLKPRTVVDADGNVLHPEGLKGQTATNDIPE